MEDKQAQKTAVRVLNLIWFGALSSVPMIATGLILYITVGEVDFGNELPVAEQFLWGVIVILVMVAVVGGRLVRSRLLNPCRLARGPINLVAQEPETPLGRAEARVRSVSMILLTLLQQPSMVLMATALYTTDIPLAMAAAAIHVLMLVPTKPDFAIVLGETVNAMEVER